MNTEKPENKEDRAASRGQVEREVRRGVNWWLEPDDGRRDLFEADEGLYHFPCGECLHRKAGREHCEKCRHWIA